MMVAIVLGVLMSAIFISPHGAVMAQSDTVRIEVLERDDCEHCRDEKAFLETLKQTRDDIQIIYHDLAEPKEKELWIQVAEIEGIPKVTPITLIGQKIVQGFDKPETTGKMFEQLIEKYKGKEQFTFEQVVQMGGTGNVEEVKDGGCDDTTCPPTEYEPLYVGIPFMGPVDIKQYSLPTLSIVLGLIDGFNPCAMWVLVTFLLILVQIGNRRRMWQIAGLFILAEAVMYYLILNVWFTVWDFVGLDNIITPIVGIVAIGGGLFFLWEWKNSDGTCKVTNLDKKKRTRSRINALAAAEMTIATIIGIIGLALSVNIIEFACSIGIPQAFTKILEINSLSLFWKHLYMSLYILFYMVDDFIVFGIALYSIEKIGLTTKYAKWCNLIGGVLMLILGAILIFKPELLIF